MNNDDLLDFLVEGLLSKQRDVVTRAFYALSEGNPDSAPVQTTVLFAAYSRRIAQIPVEIRRAHAEFRKTLEEAGELERKMLERVDRSNANVVTAFREEAARTSENLRIAGELSKKIVINAREMADKTGAVIVQADSVATELRLVKADLRTNHHSLSKTAEAAKSMATSQEATKEMVKYLTELACTNWITVGVAFGGLVGLSVNLVPRWVTMTLLALAIGFVQWISRQSWKWLVKQAEKLASTSES